MFCRGTKERSAGVAGSKIAADSKRSLVGRISGPVEEPTARRRLTKPGRDESQGHRLDSRLHTCRAGIQLKQHRAPGRWRPVSRGSGQDVNGAELPGREVGILPQVISAEGLHLPGFVCSTDR
jgi:hypothetical protein